MYCLMNILINGITLLLGLVALRTQLQTSALAGPMLRVNCPVFSPLAQSPLPLFTPIPAHACEYYDYRQHKHAQIFFCQAHFKYIYCITSGQGGDTLDSEEVCSVLQYYSFSFHSDLLTLSMVYTSSQILQCLFARIKIFSFQMLCNIVITVILIAIYSSSVQYI